MKDLIFREGHGQVPFILLPSETMAILLEFLSVD